MTIRGFMARHRVARVAAAPAALGVAAALTAWWAFTPPTTTVDTQLTASTTECHDMVTVSIAGRNDTPGDTVPRLVDANGNALPAALSSDYSSHWVDPVVNAPNAVNTALDPNAYAAVYIAYPANMDSYESAVDAGVANAETVMREIRQSCPNTRFSVVGYSEGADVARRVAMDIGHQDSTSGYGIVDPANVVGVVIFADAGRASGQGPFPGAENPYSNPDGFNTVYQTGTTATPGAGAVTGTGGDDFGALGGKVASFCSDGDLTCAAPQNISLLQLAVNVGRQLNIDSLQADGLTPATGQDVAVALGKIGFEAFNYISSQPNWMQSDQTFLDVLLTVSDPAYVPGTTTSTSKLPAESIAAEDMSPLAYLPQKVFNEIIGLIVTNQNTIPVVLSDPYQLTLGPDTGHHFDYWRDTADGKPLTSAEYAAQWLTQLATQARNGDPVVTKTTTPSATTTTTTATAPTTTATATTTTGAATTTTTTSPAPVSPSVAAAAAGEGAAEQVVDPNAVVQAPAPSSAAATDATEPTETLPTESSTANPPSSTAGTSSTSSAVVTTTTPVPASAR